MRLIALWELLTIALLLAEIIDYLRASRSAAPVAALIPRGYFRELAPSALMGKVVYLREIQRRPANHSDARIGSLHGSAAVVSFPAWRAARRKHLRDDRSPSKFRDSRQ